MMNVLKKIVLVVLFIALPSIAFGQSISSAFDSGTYSVGGVDITPSFTPLVTDLSVNYLGQIFGTVGTVLHGTSGQMLGQLFKVFNIGMLVLAGIFLIYTIVMTVINTAHEGEFMGRKWNSAWIAIRTVLGLGLLAPSMTTGYSAIQVFVMWVVVQGAGFANMAWYNGLHYIALGGSVYTPPATDIGSMVDLVGTVMEMQVCMYSAENVFQTQQKNLKQAQEQQQTGQKASTAFTAAPTAAQNYVQNFTPLFTIFQDNSKGGLYNSVVKFPGNKYEMDGQQDNACGQISFGTNASQDKLQEDQKASTLKDAVRQIMLDTDSYAKQIVNPGPQGNAQDFSNQVQSAIVGAAADWVNITLPIRAQGAGANSAALEEYAKNAVLQGWIMAGRYYYALTTIQRQVSAATSVTVNVDQQPAGFPSSSSYISFSSLPFPSVSNMTSLRDFSDQDKLNLTVVEGPKLGVYLLNARNLSKQVDQAGQINIGMGADAGKLSFLIDPIYAYLEQVIGQFATATGDPILVLQTIGTGFITLAVGLWIYGTVEVFALGVGSSVLSSVQPVGYGVEDAVFAFVPVFTAFILTFFVLGATFAYYVPLIPFIIFVFAAVGWLIAVIEAMVAAPLVALGITHPEGHDLLGKSEQAIMLLLSVFLRPVLMIIGFIAGMILSKVVLRFLNTGFFGLIYELGEGFSVFAFIGVLIIYCSLLVTIVNQAFGLIYAVPDRVMRWLGVTEQQTGGIQEALQGSKQGFEQVSGATERLGSGISTTGAQQSQKLLERSRKRWELNQGGESTSAKPK